MWQLVIIYGITWAGAGGTHTVAMPDKKTCYEALHEMKIDTNAKLATNGNGRQSIAYCAPMR